MTDDRKIRILELVYSYEIQSGGGGITRFAIELGKRIDPEFYEVSFCSLGHFDIKSESKKQITDLQNLGYEAFSATEWKHNHPYKSFFSALANLLKKNKAYQYTILHSHSEFTDIAALIIKFFNKNIKILRTVHYSYPIEWKNNPLRRLILINFLYPIFYDIEVGITPSMVNRLDNRFFSKIRKRSSNYIPNAISLNRFRETKDENLEREISLNIHPDKYIVGTVGRLTEQKGYRYLIEAIPIVLDKIPKTQFIIIGEGTEAELLKALARKFKINNNIIFTGPRKDVDRLYQCMDLFVSSSIWEGVPTVILEAMASNVPIIATDIPGTNELIQHKWSGFLVPPKDPHALANAIIFHLETPNQRRDFIINGKKTIQKYLINDVSQKYNKLFKKLINTS
jgi:glycosyltransferase involved in cell wall biosynthesis